MRLAFYYTTCSTLRQRTDTLGRGLGLEASAWPSTVVNIINDNVITYLNIGYRTRRTSTTDKATVNPHY